MIVDKKVEKVRAKTVGAVVKNLKFDDYFIKQIIQLQEKIHQTYGGNRKFAAIGVYDFDKIKFPIRYTTVKPDGIKFVPLEFNEELTPKEILAKHPCGRDYGHLINQYPEYPLMIDSKGNVLSIPPIINSSYTGKITEKTKNVFIEITGHELRRISVALNVLVTALAERGGNIYSVEIKYPDEKIIRPDLKPQAFVLDTNYARRILGLDISDKEIIKLLEKSGCNAKPGKKIIVEYPAYRDDIMHMRDIVEDIAISYGYNKIKPEFPKLSTIGSSDRIEDFCDIVRELMVGLGHQEIMTFSLTSKENLFEKMNIAEEDICEISNPVSSNWTVLRNWLLPSLLEFLTNNMHMDYPQKIFEVGDCILLDNNKETKTRNIKKLSAMITDSEVSYEEIASILDAFLRNLGVKYELSTANHPSFISGRAASINVHNKGIGTIGEIHPLVLNDWKLEKPVIAFELDLNAVLAATKI
jgi:phenylalanyl-tRNA synthetase beta chain